MRSLLTFRSHASSSGPASNKRACWDDPVFARYIRQYTVHGSVVARLQSSARDRALRSRCCSSSAPSLLRRDHQPPDLSEGCSAICQRISPLDCCEGVMGSSSLSTMSMISRLWSSTRPAMVNAGQQHMRRGRLLLLRLTCILSGQCLRENPPGASTSSDSVHVGKIKVIAFRRRVVFSFKGSISILLAILTQSQPSEQQWTALCGTLI